MEAQYSPPDHPVFQLVPPLFLMRAEAFYEDAGQPIISSDTFWDVYRDILTRFRQIGQAGPGLRVGL